MVHLEAKYEYLERIKQSAEINAIVDAILFDKIISVGEYRNDANSVAINLINCVKQNDKKKAEDLYTRFSKRNPTKESHWIYDEFVVFALVCTVQKFSFDNNWLKEVLLLTSQTSDPVQQGINETFKNLLLGNLNVKADFHQISLVYQYLSKSEHYKDERINKMFRNLWKIDFPFYDSTFLNVISIKAIEIAFEVKALLNPQDYFYSKKFVSLFLHRTLVFAIVLSSIFLIVIAFLLFLFLWNTNILNEKLISFIVSVSGVGILGVFGLHKFLRDFLTNFIRKIFGYKIIKN